MAIEVDSYTHKSGQMAGPDGARSARCRPLASSTVCIPHMPCTAPLRSMLDPTMHQMLPDRKAPLPLPFPCCCPQESGCDAGLLCVLCDGPRLLLHLWELYHARVSLLPSSHPALAPELAVPLAALLPIPISITFMPSIYRTPKRQLQALLAPESPIIPLSLRPPQVRIAAVPLPPAPLRCGRQVRLPPTPPPLAIPPINHATCLRPCYPGD